jgi:choline kinase
MGTRLNAAQPKGLVEVAGRPLIARSFEALQSAGVREFLVVTGWHGEAYEAWCARHAPGIRCVTNPDFATTGSLRSLCRGLARIPGRDFMVVESDLLFERRAAVRLLAAPESSILVSGFTGSRDEVWVYGTSRGELDEMTKIRRDGLAPVGELVGLSRFTAEVGAALIAVESALPPTAHYEQGLNALARGHPLHLELVPDLAWCEIDDRQHLARAIDVIWPRIQAADKVALS